MFPDTNIELVDFNCKLIQLLQINISDYDLKTTKKQLIFTILLQQWRLLNTHKCFYACQKELWFLTLYKAT